MNKTLLAALNDAERQLVAEAERPALDRLDEDETLALHARSGRRGTSTSASTAARRAPACQTLADAAQPRPRTVARL
ncbi:MAG TPA: hypothetical protein VHI14_01180 [Jatrophihabitantaceae bacterium]|jgi:hypothetical protein|nr:hypothetical protein [Jatrophihabitantaceae bacterium]